MYAGGYCSKFSRNPETKQARWREVKERQETMPWACYKELSKRE